MNTARKQEKLERLHELIRAIEPRLPTPAQLEQLQNQLTAKEVKDFRAWAKWREIAMGLIASGGAGWLGGPKVALALKVLTAALPVLTAIANRLNKD